jgi:hypothetical protein
LVAACGAAACGSSTLSITVCPGTVVLSYCLDSMTGQTIDPRKIEFTVDTTGTEAVIDVQ